MSLVAFLACDSPAKPSGTPALRVNAIDEDAGQAITADAFGIRITVTGPVVETTPLNKGVAAFPELPPGTYRVTTDADYGYVQLDVVNVTVDDPESLTLKLKPIDDAAVTEVFVEGQGSITKGGTIDVPAEGVSLHFRGRYQSVKVPWQSTFVVVETLTPDGRAFGASICCAPMNDPVGPTDFDYRVRGWRPCSGAFCSSTATALNVKLSKMQPGDTPLMNKTQQWPLNFRLVP